MLVIKRAILISNWYLSRRGTSFYSTGQWLSIFAISSLTFLPLLLQLLNLLLQADRWWITLDATTCWILRHLDMQNHGKNVRIDAETKDASFCGVVSVWSASFASVSAPADVLQRHFSTSRSRRSPETLFQRYWSQKNFVTSRQQVFRMSFSICRQSERFEFLHKHSRGLKLFH